MAGTGPELISTKYTFARNISLNDKPGNACTNDLKEPDEIRKAKEDLIEIRRINCTLASNTKIAEAVRTRRTVNYWWQSNTANLQDNPIKAVLPAGCSPLSTQATSFAVCSELAADNSLELATASASATPSTQHGAFTQITNQAKEENVTRKLLKVQATPGCIACGKSVYAAEEIRALGQRWHKVCFACQHCKKTLQPGQYSDSQGDPYCTGCYLKLKGPRGVGFGAAGAMTMDTQPSQ